MMNVLGQVGRSAAVAMGFAAALALAVPARAKSGCPASAGKTTALGSAAELVPALHAINQIGIHAGRTAEERGASEAVRQYGATLVRDHQAAEENLRRYAARQGVDVNGKMPAPVDLALEHARWELANLSTVGGQAFDHELASLMLQDQEQAIRLLDQARPSITDPKLRAMVGEVEPNLREHEQIASNILNGFAAP